MSRFSDFLTNIKNRLPEIGRYNSWPAGIIDRAYLADSRSFLSRLWRFAKTITVFVCLFIPLSAVDLLASAALGLRYALGTFFITDDLQERRLSQQQKYATIFSKNLYALAASIFGFPFIITSLLDIRTIVFYFTPEKTAQKGISAGGGLYYDEEAIVEEPETVEELQRIITTANHENTKVMVVGAGRSQGKQFLPGEQRATVVNLRKLKLNSANKIVIDKEAKTATVTAGVLWHELQTKANKRGLCVLVEQASPIFSVGGSIGANAHGWDHLSGSVSHTIEKMDIIDGSGKLHKDVRPDDELFHLVTGGLGLFGIVTQVTLKLGDNKLLRENGVQMTAEDYGRHMYQIQRDAGNTPNPADYFEEGVELPTTTLPEGNIPMTLFRLTLDAGKPLSSGVGVFYVEEDKKTQELFKQELDKKRGNNLSSSRSSNEELDNFDDEEELSPSIVTPNYRPERAKGTRFDTVMINLVRRFSWLRTAYFEGIPGLLRGERARLITNDTPPQTTNEIMQPAINAMFNPSVSETEWLQEFFLPPKELQAFLNELGPLLKKNEVGLLNASVRFVRQNAEAPLSYANKGDRLAVVLCFTQSLEPHKVLEAKKWIREAQNMAVKRGGSYYLVYQHLSSPQSFNEAYPEAHRAIAAREKFDPKSVFSSGFEQKYLREGESDELDHLQVIMATPETRREFKGFLANVLQRVDAEKLFNLLEEIMRDNDTREERYKDLLLRLPDIMPSAPVDLYHILGSLSGIKKDLAEQARKVLPENLKEIDGLVEIGYPGRYVGGFKEQFKVKGKIVAIHENDPSASDYLQTGFPKPYHEHRKFDYNHPHRALKGLQDNSASVITCYVGLHHFPPHRLNKFLEEVRRVLKPGGHFLIEDHDILVERDEDKATLNPLSLSVAHMAHTIFNAVTGVSWEAERDEIRNFQPMSYWIEKLGKHGFDCAVENIEEQQIRQGDSSRNRMVSFVKAEGIKAQLRSISVLESSDEEDLGYKRSKQLQQSSSKPKVSAKSTYKEKEKEDDRSERQQSNKVWDEKRADGKWRDSKPADGRASVNGFHGQRVQPSLPPKQFVISDTQSRLG